MTLSGGYYGYYASKHKSSNFFHPGNIVIHDPFFLFALSTIASSILITWVYNQTRGSVLLALLFHTALNMTWLYLPLSLFADWRVVLTHCLVALVVVLVSGTYLGRKARARPEEALQNGPFILKTCRREE